MKLIVRQLNKHQANIIAEPGRPLVFEIIDKGFQPWLAKLTTGKISVMKDFLVEDGHQMFLTETDKFDEHYGLAIKQYLERQGFEVVIDDPELDQAVLRAVQSLPDDIPGKAEVLAELPNLTVLEKTTLLENIGN